MATIGMIGVGLLGSAIAARLQAAGYTVVGYDIVPDRRIGASTAQEVADKAATIVLCLPTSDHVRSVIFGADGLAAAAKSGTLIVDQTTGDPAATRAMAAELATRRLELIDAPVSGGPRGADAGTIAVMVGAVLPLPVVWSAADITNALMAIPNLISLIVLAGVVVAETDRYLWSGDPEDS